MIELLDEHAQALVHAINLPRVAAQQVVAQVKTVLHHLEADGVGDIGELFGPVLALHRRPVDENSTSTIVRMIPKFTYSFLPIVMPCLLRSVVPYRGSNLKSMIPLLSDGDGSKRHFLAASRAALARTGCPPTTRASFTVPLGATVTSILTVPAILIFRASSG